MGLPFSVFNKFGLPELSSLTSGLVYDLHFKHKKTDNFENFHIAYVEFCKYCNIVMPGQDFDTPPLEEIMVFYDTWSGKGEDERKQAFIDYMESHVSEAKVDDGRKHAFIDYMESQAKVDESLFIMAGLAAPAAAIIAKRAGKSVPQVKKLKLNYIPNVVFVPLCTLFAIMGVTAVQMNKNIAEISSKIRSIKSQ